MTRTSEERVLRTIGPLFGAAGAIFGLLTLPAILDQLTDAPLPWTVAALVATLGLPVALGVVAPFGRPRTIRLLGALVGIGNLLAMATTPLAFPLSATVGESPWVLQLTALGTTGAALGLPMPIALADVAITGGLVTLDRIATASPRLGLLIPVQDGLYAAMFALIFVGLAIGALGAARSVDRATEDAVAAIRAARDERVRADERARVNGLVHDHVLTTLLVAGRDPDPAPGLSVIAAEALERLRELSAPSFDRIAVPVQELLARLRTQLTVAAPDASIGVEGERTSDVPVTVVEALVGAAGEALRNIRRHAGPCTVQVHVQLGHDRVEVAVLDDGAGFQRSAVPPNRLGIAASIEGRMRQIGGRAEVLTAPGRGTAVLLHWEDR